MRSELMLAVENIPFDQKAFEVMSPKQVPT